MSKSKQKAKKQDKFYTLTTEEEAYMDRLAIFTAVGQLDIVINQKDPWADEKEKVVAILKAIVYTTEVLIRARARLVAKHPGYSVRGAYQYQNAYGAVCSVLAMHEWVTDGIIDWDDVVPDCRGSANLQLLAQATALMAGAGAVHMDECLKEDGEEAWPASTHFEASFMGGNEEGWRGGSVTAEKALELYREDLEGDSHKGTS